IKDSNKPPKDSTKVKVSKLDSIKNINDNLVIKLGHAFLYETKHYRFKKSAAGTVFGDSYETSIQDHTSYQNMENQLYLELYTPYTGTLRAKANHYKYNYHYNSVLFLDTITISDRLKGNVFSAGADWKATIGNLSVNADATSIISGDLTGNSIKASVNYKKDSVFSIKGYAEVTSKSPSLNKILYQSAFKDYNWKNNFDNEELKNAGIEFKLNKWGSINASYNLIDNYTYFDTISRPTQAKETLNYIKVKANQYFTFRNFTLDNTVMYQNVLEGESFFHVPQIVTRNTLYYANYVFKGKPLYLQTGVTFKYFTAFKSNAYNPLLSEFVLQNETEIGNYPILDFFFNMQVQRTRIFLKVENFGAGFTGRNYYSAPNYPYRDLTVRFGLVWNFFI
ncbi:putative porin, partial [Lutibacter sp.]|uniref:putative porin n=1 Tax=Lutibacter sp. TaxID=1925666 RepID=UPI0034A00C16